MKYQRLEYYTGEITEEEITHCMNAETFDRDEAIVYLIQAKASENAYEDAWDLTEEDVGGFSVEVDETGYRVRHQ